MKNAFAFGLCFLFLFLLTILGQNCSPHQSGIPKVSDENYTNTSAAITETTGTTLPACTIASYNEFLNCRSRLYNNLTTTLIFITQLDCTDKDCHIEIVGKTGITIAGYGTDMGMKRRSGYNRRYITISNSTTVNIVNLKFDDGEIDTDFTTNKPRSCGSNCADQVVVYNSNDIKVSYTKFFGSKATAISFVLSKNIVIKNSQFGKSAVFGMNFDSANSTNENITIKYNYFFDNRSNAIIITGKRIRIFGNIFNHNHFGSVFSTCGSSGHDLCNGGQLLLMSLDDAIVEENFIMHSRLDQQPSTLFVMDIEIGLEPQYNLKKNVTNLFIRNNDFYYDHINDNRFYWSITTNPSAFYYNVIIENNRFRGYPTLRIYLNPGSIERYNQLLP